MEKISPSEFTKLSLNDKHILLKERGNYIASRFFGEHNCFLFALDGFYVEVYKVIGLNQIHWIELLNNQSIIDDYLENI